MTNTFTVGQTVYGEPGENMRRYNSAIIEGEVKKVGRKYVTVDFDGSLTEYHIKNLLPKKEDGVPDYYLRLSMEPFLIKEVIREIQSYLGGGNSKPTISLAQAEAALAIFKNENAKEDNES